MRFDGSLSSGCEFDWLIVKHNTIEKEQHMGMENPLHM